MKKAIKTLKVFYTFEAKRRWLFAFFIFTVVLRSIVNSILPFFSKYIVEFLTQQNYRLILISIFAFFGLRFLALAVSSFSYIVGDIVNTDAIVNAKLEVFKRLQDLDFAFHNNKSSGSLISAIKRGESAWWSLYHDINHRLLELAVGFLVMIGVFLQLDWRIAFISLVSLVIGSIATQYVVSINVRYRELLNEWDDKISAIVVDNLINYDTVKLFAKENWEMDRLQNTYSDWKISFWKYVNTFRLIDWSIGSIVNISIFIILLLTYQMFTKQTISLGNFVLVIAFINSFFPRLFDLVYNYRDLANSFTDIKKYLDLLDNKVEILDPENPLRMDHVKGEIVFKDVSFSYKDGKKNAVKNVNLTIPAGKSVAFVGRSGSGKTTITKLLMRFFDVSSGQITIDGNNIKNFTKSDLRGFMGVVPQEPIMFNNTISYNIGYGKSDATKEEIDKAAKVANLYKYINKLPKKYETMVGERGIKLSGGQKQRLAIARMILSNPDIIIFDEATSQLDSENEKLIQEAFWKVAKGKTTLIIAHRLSTVKRADLIIVMESGKIVEIGTHADLVKGGKSLYAHFWNLQTSSH